jgi:hypothetical protein
MKVISTGDAADWPVEVPVASAGSVLTEQAHRVRATALFALANAIVEGLMGA